MESPVLHLPPIMRSNVIAIEKRAVRNFSNSEISFPIPPFVFVTADITFFDDEERKQFLFVDIE